MAKVEWHQGDLFPRIGFVVTNMGARARGVVHFYNGRGAAEQQVCYVSNGRGCYKQGDIF